MKKFLVVSLALMMGISFGICTASAGNAAGDIKLSGPHWQFNLVGHPKGYKGDGADSNGRAILIPLKNADSDVDKLTCPEDGFELSDDTFPLFYTEEPVGAKLYFTPGDTFEIVDRDATDGSATIMIPTMLQDNPLYDPEYPDVYPTTQQVIAVDVYIRALGKPSTCINIGGWAQDETQGLYFWAGTVALARQPGKSVFEKINELFDVNWCQVDAGVCLAGTTKELSVFNDVFESYFWNIQNDGTRLVQVRLYPKTER